jgi:hypothetical protein
MAVSHQHLRGSQVLHSDYYSKTKKTASTLTNRVRAGDSDRDDDVRGGRRATSPAPARRGARITHVFSARLQKCL